MGTTGESDNRGANLVVVALPSKDDYIWKISSEKVPHLTLLFLGENKLGDQTSHVVDYIQHAVSTSLDRFGLSVDHRGELGEDKADVLFFEKAYAKNLELFRSHLLANRSIAEAYHSTEQFPTWTPHLTLGYPASPAKPDTRDYPGISWVNFDRIALWTSDSDGPTFELTSNDRLEEVSMSQVQPNAVEEFFEHQGVKGMKWGVRKDRGHEGEQAKTRKIARLDKRFTRGRGTLGTAIKLHNRAAELTNKNDVERINNKPQYKGQDFRRDTPLRKKYYKEHQDAFLKNLETAAKEHGTNASGTQRYTIVEMGNGAWDVAIRDVKHANEAGGERFVVTVVYDKQGHVVSIEPSKATAEHSDETSAFLSHFGVKGMKWGFRKDGVSTGRKAAGSKESPDSKKAAAAKAKVGRKGNTKALSNDELQSLVKRMNLEKQYRNLSGEKSTAPVPAKLALSGAKFTSKFVSDVGTGIAKQQATRVGNDFATTYVNDMLKKAMKK